MRNHFHLVVETPLANSVSGMKWFLGTYAGRYKAIIVDGSGNGYLKTVCDYVHLNPVRAKLLQPEESLKSYLDSCEKSYHVCAAMEQRALVARFSKV